MCPMAQSRSELYTYSSTVLYSATIRTYLGTEHLSKWEMWMWHERSWIHNRPGDPTRNVTELIVFVVISLKLRVHSRRRSAWSTCMTVLHTMWWYPSHSTFPGFGSRPEKYGPCIIYGMCDISIIKARPGICDDSRCPWLSNLALVFCCHWPRNEMGKAGKNSPGEIHQDE